MTQQPLLRVQGLNLDFATSHGVAHVLRDVSITVPRGSIVGVVGESGSGKSTLASAIMRLLPANLERLDGRILLGDTDLLTLSDQEMRRLRGNRVSMIFQDPMTSLNPVFTIETQMVDVQRAKFPQRSRAEMRNRAVEMMRKVGIADAEKRLKAYPHEFSGGMRQRIMIAMALLTEPDLLIADEPTTALDVTIEAQIIRLLEDLRETFDGSILFISHSLGVVSSLCDEVVVMYAGTVVESAPAKELFTNPRHPYTRALLACEIVHEADGARRLHSIPGEVPDLFDVPKSCIYSGRCDKVIESCNTRVPALTPVGENHHKACLLP
jgi:peptide/nickel transport system ATP-binding protein